jgi:hypothetical protein
MTMTDRKVSLWTIYDHPDDYPESFVARRFEVTAPDDWPATAEATADVIESASLAPLREGMVERGLTVIPRSPEDQSNIVESWL